MKILEAIFSMPWLVLYSLALLAKKQPARGGPLTAVDLMRRRQALAALLDWMPLQARTHGDIILIRRVLVWIDAELDTCERLQAAGFQMAGTVPIHDASVTPEKN